MLLLEMLVSIVYTNTGYGPACTFEPKGAFRINLCYTVSYTVVNGEGPYNQASLSLTLSNYTA
jgi:hypothetical protein